MASLQSLAVMEQPILYLLSVSPSGWATVTVGVGHGEATNEQHAVSLRDVRLYEGSLE